ncbi:molybdopterin synthase sulfur carrier subunit [Geomonas limicola]|uniref:Molybdopterin synthase sulfur carrier subunit n=1 Tax=Geomonas limicola TaxID=2740186 RepID=A0A6V8N831_9BACT|nr:MoaD family protein [Geomonas limicola]GFO67927.1 molybdopterin synthase sulfur carrier subunit [Geomonas limicola]
MLPSSSTSAEAFQVRVQIFGLLRLMLNGLESLEVRCAPGETVGSLLEKFQAALAQPVTHKLLTPEGELWVGTIILVNRRNVLHLEGLQTPIQAGDVVALFPPGAGG